VPVAISIRAIFLSITRDEEAVTCLYEEWLMPEGERFCSAHAQRGYVVVVVLGVGAGADARASHVWWGTSRRNRSLSWDDLPD
jgi:hypothetical protein